MGLLVCLAVRAWACPFYQEIPTNVSTTTNYTTLDDAIGAACVNFYIVYVCDQSAVGASETIRPITCPLHIMGTAQVGAVFSYLTIENTNTSTVVFLINTTSGASVVFENINIVSDHTLFSVVGESQLTLYNMRCWGGYKCVEVNTVTDSPLPAGLFADTVKFYDNAYGIFHASGYVRCYHCTFYNSITGAIITNSTAPDPWIYITLYDWDTPNVLFPMGIQYTPDGAVSAALLSAAYADRTMYRNTQTYVPAASFGSSDTCAPCAECEPCTSTRFTQIIFGIGFWAIVFACCLVCVTRSRSNKDNTPSKTPSK